MKYKKETFPWEPSQKVKNGSHHSIIYLNIKINPSQLLFQGIKRKLFNALQCHLTDACSTQNDTECAEVELSPDYSQ